VLQPLERLAPEEVIQHHEDLTFPPIARRLAVRPVRGRWLGALALAETGPVGLAVAELRPAEAAQLVSFTVLPAHRRRGLGTALLGAVERLAADGGAEILEGSYRTSWRSREAIEALLRSRDWSPPESRMLLARGETSFAQSVLQTPQPTLPPEAEIFPWDDLTPDERQAIEARQGEDRWYPDVLTPFQEEPRLEPRVSVGLRWQGEVAGWMICHRVAFDTIQYSAFFLREDLRGRGLGWALVREAVRRRLADPDLRFAIFAIDARNERMRELVEGRLRDYFRGLSELRVSRKSLMETTP
jgi:GNAT superfamily N-acetyltransferase